MIIIKYSFLNNILSLAKTLKAKRWLDKNGYIYNLNFIDLFKNEFNRVQKIKFMLQSIDVKDKTFIVYLSKFDTFGSYELPNKIFLNIYQPLNQIKDTFNHESKHLEIEEEVRRRKLSHKQKENMVNDLIRKNNVK